MRLHVPALLLALACPAAAQTINLDFGPASPYGKPQTTYGAETMNPGHWNQVSGMAGPYSGALGGAIVDAAGLGTPVQVRLTSGADDSCSFQAGCTGAEPSGSDTEALLDDYSRFSGTMDVYIRDLEPGFYGVYVYCWAPDDPNARTRVYGTSVGGPWAGAQADGVTYKSKPMVPVGAGAPLRIRLQGSTGTLNGIQLEFFGSTVGTNDCPSQPNSSGFAAELTSHGSDLAFDNHLFLGATQLPPHEFGLLLTSPEQGNNPGAGGSSGTLCLDGPIGRYTTSILQSDADGHVFAYPDLTMHPTPSAFTTVLPGDRLYFQVWFRDVEGGFPTSNFTNGLCVEFR